MVVVVLNFEVDPMPLIYCNYKFVVFVLCFNSPENLTSKLGQNPSKLNACTASNSLPFFLLREVFLIIMCKGGLF